MNKFFSVLASALILTAVSCTKSSPESEAKAALNKAADIYNSAATKIESAKTAEEAAEVLVTFSKEMAAFSKEAEALEKKYPDFKTKSEKDFVEEEKKLNEAAQNFAGKMMPLALKYGTSPEFQKAMTDIQQILSGSGSSSEESGKTEE